MTGPRAPLGVQINDGKADRTVTRAVRDLRFRKTAPGGFHSASMRIVLPRSTFTDLGPADKVKISDGRTAATVWEGFTENPGTQDGPGGQGFDLSAMGTTVLVSDESRALIYIDRTLDKWTTATSTAAGTSIDQSGDPTGTDDTLQGFKAQFLAGQPIVTNSAALIAYAAPFRYGMEIGSVSASTLCGKTDSGYDIRLVSSGSFGTVTATPNPQSTLSTTAATFTRYTGDASGPPSGADRISIRMIRDGGATNIADDTTWAYFHNIVVTGRRLNRLGVANVGVADTVTGQYVLASWVVEDMLGRLLTFCDKGLSRVDTTTWQIDQLAYHDGAKAAQIFDDLTLWEPDFLWEMLHSTPAGYVFNFRAWPTTARYEISVDDGYIQPGADVDLCNRIAVYWTDSRGNTVQTVRGASVPALGNGSPVLADGTRDPAYTGRVRDADPITLPAGQGSLTNAQRIGDQVLAAKANPPKAATAVVKRRIMDRLSGNTVMPWELEPGYLVRVRETGDVMRCTEMEYVDADVATTLTLGEPQLTIEQRVARLSKKVA